MAFNIDRCFLFYYIILLVLFVVCFPLFVLCVCFVDLKFYFCVFSHLCFLVYCFSNYFK